MKNKGLVMAALMATGAALNAAREPTVHFARNRGDSDFQRGKGLREERKRRRREVRASRRRNRA